MSVVTNHNKEGTTKMKLLLPILLKALPLVKDKRAQAILGVVVAILTAGVTFL